MTKKLYRAKQDKKLAGVCGGFAKYLDLDPTIVRVAWAIISLFAGAGVIAYILCAVIMSEEPNYNEAE